MVWLITNEFYILLGRTGPGVCYRLYEESQYDDLQRYSTPEILRVPLDGLVLQMIAMGLPNARKYVCMDKFV